MTLIDPKGKAEERDHLVPLLPEALSILKEVRSFTGKAEWPFTTDGRRCIRPETLSKALAELRKVKKNGKPIFTEPFGFSDIRRTVETQLAAFGISKEMRAQLLSHGRGDPISRAYDKYRYLPEKQHALEVWRDFLHEKRSAKR